jgi:predicted MFS family arabinose efflux permease
MRLSEDLEPKVPAKPTSSPAELTTEEKAMAEDQTASTSSDSPATDSPPEEARGISAVLKNKNFLALWGGQVFSQLADKFYLVLMIAIIETQFQAKGQTISGWVSAIMMANTIPAILFGSFAGVYVDRWRKKQVLVVTNILRGLLVLAVPILLWIAHGRIIAQLPLGFELLILITFTVSTLSQFFAPAEQAVVSNIVEKRDLLSANSLYTTTNMGALVVGLAVGEPLLGFADKIGMGFGLGLNVGKELVVGLSYTISGVLLLLLKNNEQKRDANIEEPHILDDLKEGIRYLQANRSIRVALIQLVTLYAVFASITILAIRLAEILPEIKASQFGFLLATGGIGMGLGAVVLSFARKWFTPAKLAFFGSIGIAVGLGGMAISTHSLWQTILSITLIGVFWANVAIPMQTVVQSETPPEMRGKVFGLQNNATNIALSLPLALTGIAESVFGVSSVLWGLALIVTLLTLYLYGWGSAKSE